jgi:predicted PurR-regulated permease PerM
MIDKKSTDKFIIIILVAILFIVAFIILRELIVSIFYGLILAYILHPIQRRVSKKIKNETLSALIVSIVFFVIVIFAALLIITSLINQTTSLFNSFQNVDLKGVITKILPKSMSTGSSDTIIGSLNSYITNFATGLENKAKNFFLDTPRLLLDLIITIFVFFFALRDGKKLLEYIRSLSPFKTETTERIIKRFREVTSSVLLGQVLVGLLQGIVCGIGYFIFGVPNLVVLIYITIIVSLIPFAGHGLVWVPVDIYLFVIGRTTAGIGFLIYGLIVITAVENLSRPIFVSRKTHINTGIIIIGMMGGLLTIGFSGLILGPLILSYILLMFDIYKKEVMIKKEETASN